MSTAQIQGQRKLVAFLLNDEYFAIDVHHVKEVFVPDTITPIPQAGDYTAGVINYRGLVVTVIDLKRRLLVEEHRKRRKEYLDDDERNYILMVTIGKTTVGLLVDYVEAVITVTDENIQQSIEGISTSKSSTFIEGIVKTDLGLVVLLKTEGIFSDFDLKELEKLAKIRTSIHGEEKDDEITLTGKEIDKVNTMEDFSIDDLSDDDDVLISDKGIVSATSIKTTAPAPEPEEDEFGSSPLDLGALTKPELLKIAYEMGIDSVSTKTKKDKLIKLIQDKMK